MNKKYKEMDERFEKYVIEEKLINKEDILLLAVSGGPDSIFMFNQIIRLNKKYNMDLDIYILHLNHGIREEATIDENIVLGLEKKENIKVYLKKVDMPKIHEEKKGSLENLSRIERYTFFNEIYEKIKQENINKEIKLVIGHHKGDIAEKIIFNLARGTGIKGVITQNSTNDSLFKGEVIRPLIIFEKNEILEYLNINNISYAIDKTNFENDYTRNKIRNIVIPYLIENINSNVVNNFYEFSKILEEENIFLNKLSIDLEKNVLIENTKNKKIIDLKQFNTLDIVIRKRIIIHIIKTLSNNTIILNLGQIQDILHIALKNEGGKYIRLKDKIIIEISKSKMIIKKEI